ncbi:ubiquitin carboxyl-terminal hydrolase 20 [Eutrema salsugineum]|uniref:ubiquitin carboxyl-terminal hydrolase 20 n=1 Tax=Eutrema salsugineum TaxID=72664 RepID=UPI000CED3E2A|nr:ubiquitin carboxyl-terminal hydrolase 20 [Eutrema salsugineum]
MLMADSDVSSSVIHRSPLIPNPVETLDESSSPIASIGAHAVQSLALSSPNRDRDDDDLGSLSTEPSTPPRNSVGSSSAPLNETLIFSSPVSSERGECNDTQIVSSESQNQPEGNDNNSLQMIESTSQAQDEIDEIFKDPWTSNGYETDDDSSTDWNQGLKWWRKQPSKPMWRCMPEPMKIAGVGAGLWNLGNSCFVNSVLQCLTHTVPLIESLCLSKSQDPCNCGNVFCVRKTLRGHIIGALTTSEYSISPLLFLNNLCYFSPDFRRYQQEDAHEFLQAFLDKLDRCCFDPRSDRGDASSQDANIVQHVFGGRLVSGLRCCSCNSVSETFEESLGLSLEIEDVDDLSSALNSFTRVEKLEEQLTCDNCNEQVSKEKQLLLDKLPLVATFHLKRFKNNGYFMEKIFNDVRVPLEIDLQPYMSSNQENEVATKYYLYALVKHYGSLVYGHYVSYVRSAPTIWHRFDDKQVTRIEEDSVLADDSYILFYAREGTPCFSTAYEEVQPLLEASLQYSSPKSVLDPTNGECLSEISYENVYQSKKQDVKTDENPVSVSNEADEDVYLSSGEDFPMEELLDMSDDSYNPCLKKKEPDSFLAFERAATGHDDSVPLLMAQSQDSSEGTFQIQHEQMELAKNQEEEKACRQPLVIDLSRKPLPRARHLDQAISRIGSPPKKLKTA